jgi:hypothetical protein
MSGSSLMVRDFMKPKLPRNSTWKTEMKLMLSSSKSEDHNDPNKSQVWNSLMKPARPIDVLYTLNKKFNSSLASWLLFLKKYLVINL